MKRGAVIVAMVALVSLCVHGVWGQSAKTRLTDPAQAHLFNDISDRLVCQCGCQMMLRVCNHQNCPSATPMRASIEKQIEEGADPDVIVAGFVDEHGVKVLSTPPAEGLNLAAWVMPGFAILVGLLLIVHYAGHWAARRRKAAIALGPTMDASVRARIERELSEDS